MATFLSTNFGAKTGLPASGDSNISCCALAVICAFSNKFRDRSLFTGGGGEGHYIWGEGDYFLSSTLGRAMFKKSSLRGGLRVFQIISIYHQSLNSEFS